MAKIIGLRPHLWGGAPQGGFLDPPLFVMAIDRHVFNSLAAFRREVNAQTSDSITKAHLLEKS